MSGPRLVWDRVLAALDRYGRAAVVTLAATRGSSPREAGARMIVHPDGTFTGTIGGGALEWKAIALAQAALADPRAPKAAPRGFALGPELGQCCGGNVDLIVELIESERRGEIATFAGREKAAPFVTQGRLVADRGVVRQVVEGAMPPGAASFAAGVLTEGFGDLRRPVYLFGAGHVGRALVLAMAPLPFRVTWVDPRPDAFPSHVPANVTPVQADDPARILGEAPEGAFVVVMSHSHALDQDLVTAALQRNRFPYVGLIGSRTKRARFEKRLKEAGVPADRIAALVCPVGATGARSKEPAVIAAMTAAELLARDEAVNAAVEPNAQSSGRRSA